MIKNKIYVYPADTQGCGYYRLIWPALALKNYDYDYDIEIVKPRERGLSLKAEITNGHVTKVIYPKDAIAIVLQRITHIHLVEAIKLMIDDGLTVIIDMDDNLSKIDPNNPAWTAMHPRYGYDKRHNWHNAQLACNDASFVTVSTSALLQQYVRHGRGVVINNHVPKRYLDILHEDSNQIGWGGALHVHPSDVHVLGHSIVSLIKDTDKTFKVVGPANGVAQVLNCPEEKIVGTGTLDLLTEWPEKLSTLGIGVAPLADTEFNRAKSHLKILEYSAVGVPWVASPRDEYVNIHKKYGVGLLASKPTQWLRRINELIQNPILRQKLSKSGREWAEQYVIENNSFQWANAWTTAINSR